MFTTGKAQDVHYFRNTTTYTFFRRLALPVRVPHDRAWYVSLNVYCLFYISKFNDQINWCRCRWYSQYTVAYDWNA